ncbi:uncharacterized protein [Diadema antillarum]|uniref:uncharacterized protein n=1 Tax=Diadema antillarum TaxID=105358 RepID=UPI003A8AE0EE
MIRMGKRSLGKITIILLTGLLVFLAALSVWTPGTEEMKDNRLRIHPVKPGKTAVRDPKNFAAKKASAKLVRARGPGPNKLLSQNVSWRRKSVLSGQRGPSKTNISLRHANVSRQMPPRAKYNVLKSKSDIRAMMENLKKNKEQRMKAMSPPQNKSEHRLVSKSRGGFCLPHFNVAYIKTHKTASTTLQTIVNRFGLLHNLSFVLNKISPTNGHLVYIPVTKYSPKIFFLPPLGHDNSSSERFRYNMVAVHLRYNRSAMDSFMMPGTKYISIIREPSAHFESAFNHFRFTDSFSPATKCRVKGREIQEFMRKPGYYRRQLKKLPWDTTRGLRWYYARNNQIFDLGLDSKYHGNDTEVRQTVDTLVHDMDFVLISEYFDESLVVLMKMLCWTFDDIVYISKNQRINRMELDEPTRQKIRQWNRADVILYDRFNKTLWRKIREYGPSFGHDLATFRKRKEEVFSRCVGNSTIKSHGMFKHREYTPSANSSTFCTYVAESKTRLFHRIWLRQAGSWNDKLKAARLKALKLQKMKKEKMKEKQSGDKVVVDAQQDRRANYVANPDGVRTRENEDDDDDDDVESIHNEEERKPDNCRNLPEEDINFASSEGTNLVFPEEI